MHFFLGAGLFVSIISIHLCGNYDYARVGTRCGDCLSPTVQKYSQTKTMFCEKRRLNKLLAVNKYEYKQISHAFISNACTFHLHVSFLVVPFICNIH